MIVLTCAALGQDQAGQTTSKLIVEHLNNLENFSKCLKFAKPIYELRIIHHQEDCGCSLSQ